MLHKKMRPGSCLQASALFLAFVVTASAGAAESAFTANLNFQGFTGLMNIPTARVLDYGDFQYNFSNLNDLSGNAGYRDGYNNQLGAGVFPGIELALRNVTSDRDSGSDLSGNIKLQVPYISSDTWSVALGAQDIGGAANYYDGQYVVGSYRWRSVDVSLGVGTSESPLGRMDGLFGGIEWSPMDWLSLMAEHDGHAENFTLRLNTPRRWLGGKVQLSAMAQLYSTYESPLYDDFFAISIKAPLFSSDPRNSKINQNRGLPPYHRAEQFRRVKTETTAASGMAIKPVIATDAAIVLQPNAPAALSINSHTVPAPEAAIATTVTGRATLQELANRLARQGFEGIKVAQQKQALYVRFESAVFNRHSMDGLGVAMGIIADLAPADAEQIQLVLMKWGVAVFMMEGELASYRQFLADETRQETGLVMQTSPWDFARDQDWVTAGRSPYFKARWTIRPELAMALGTEVGVLDYSFAWRHELELPMWPGGALYTAYDFPERHTRDFNDGGVFMNSRHSQGRKHLMLSQAFVLPWHISTQFMAGEYATQLSQYDAATNESWIDFNTPFNLFPGSHLIRTFIGEYDNQEFEDRRQVRLLSYRYYLDVINSSIELTGGDFFNDSGWKVEGRHFLGDTTVSAYFKKNDDDIRMFGLSISVPLTARKDMGSRYGVQVKGPASWRNDIETRVGDDHNQHALGVTAMPTLTHGLRGTYYDNDRLNPAWVQRHSPRLREAYQRFRNDEGNWGSWGSDTGINKLIE